MTAGMSGEATPAQIGAFLLALRTKGETVEEVEGLARAMLSFAVPVHAPQPVIDTCVDCALHDGKATLKELEVLRAVCEALECPLPPVLPPFW